MTSTEFNLNFFNYVTSTWTCAKCGISARWGGGWRVVLADSGKDVCDQCARTHAPLMELEAQLKNLADQLDLVPEGELEAEINHIADFVAKLDDRQPTTEQWPDRSGDQTEAVTRPKKNSAGSACRGAGGGW